VHVRARWEAGCRGWHTHLSCGLWVRHSAAGSVATGVGGGGAIASELELRGHRHKHGERRGSTKYSPRSFMAAWRNRGRPSARRGWSIVLDVGLGNGLGTTAKQQKASPTVVDEKNGYGRGSVGFYGELASRTRQGDMTWTQRSPRWRCPMRLRHEEEEDPADRWGQGGSERGEGNGGGFTAARR